MRPGCRAATPRSVPATSTRPRGRDLQAGQAVEQRRLAGAARADDRDELAGRHGQRHPGEGRPPGAEVLPEVDGGDGGRAARPGPGAGARGGSAGTAPLSHDASGISRRVGLRAEDRPVRAAAEDRGVAAVRQDRAAAQPAQDREGARGREHRADREHASRASRSRGRTRSSRSTGPNRCCRPTAPTPRNGPTGSTAANPRRAWAEPGEDRPRREPVGARRFSWAAAKRRAGRPCCCSTLSLQCAHLAPLPHPCGSQGARRVVVTRGSSTEKGCHGGADPHEPGDGCHARRGGAAAAAETARRRTARGPRRLRVHLAVDHRLPRLHPRRDGVQPGDLVQPLQPRHEPGQAGRAEELPAADRGPDGGQVVEQHALLRRHGRAAGDRVRPAPRGPAQPGRARRGLLPHRLLPAEDDAVGGDGVGLPAAAERQHRRDQPVPRASSGSRGRSGSSNPPGSSRPSC